MIGALRLVAPAWTPPARLTTAHACGLRMSVMQSRRATSVKVSTHSRPARATNSRINPGVLTVKVKGSLCRFSWRSTCFANSSQAQLGQRIRVLDDRLATGLQYALELDQVVEDVPVLNMDEDSIRKRRVHRCARDAAEAAAVGQVVLEPLVAVEPLL